MIFTGRRRLANLASGQRKSHVYIFAVDQKGEEDLKCPATPPTSVLDSRENALQQELRA